MGVVANRLFAMPINDQSVSFDDLRVLLTVVQTSGFRLAARQLGRPVKVALTRPQIYNHTSHRPATIQRLRLGAGADGKLTAIGLEGTERWLIQACEQDGEIASIARAA